nr:ABC transporter ATP-binding protein [uncultured Acetatifactor sp.]
MKRFVETYRNIFWLYKPYLKYGKRFVFCSWIFWICIVPVVQIITVHLPSTIINMLQAGESYQNVVICVIGMQMMLMLQPVYEDVFNMFCKNRALPYIEAKLKQDVYKKAVETDYEYIDDPEYFDNYTWAVNQYAAKAQDAQEMTNRMSSSTIVICSMLTVIAVLSPFAVVVTIVGTIIENFMYIVVNYYDMKKEEEVLPYDRKQEYYHKVFYDNADAADLKSTNLGTYLLQGYDRAQQSKLNTIKKYGYKMIPWALGGDLAFYVARTFVILNIAYGIYVGDIPTVATYITMMAAVEVLKNSMNEMFYYVKDANRLGMYAKRIRAFFDLESHIETDMKEKVSVSDGAFAVEFRDVQFRYKNSEFHIEDFNLKINAGEKIAIVGENGAGKSTLVKLLMRFYDVNSGAILLNGRDIRDYELKGLRKKIGVAFQNPNVYAISFAENIGLYKRVDYVKMQQIIRDVGLEIVLQKNNATIDSEVTKEFDERGIMLSGGERQKMAIARLFVSEFGLLILDEPSSALDPIAEHKMTKLIFDISNQSTTIIVAHRLSTIRDADKIVLVDGGRIAEMGTHDELMAMHGKYSEMFSKQAENYIC